MARMDIPRRAMMLAVVFVVAACEVGADTGALAVSGIGAEPLAAGHGEVVETTEQIASDAIVDNSVESLVAMSGPASDEGLLGAGCVSEPDEPLPDGDWFGFVLETHTHHLVVDIACVYGPDTDQFQAYAADTDSTWSSYVVVNDVVAERSLRFGSASQAYMAADDWQSRTVREVVEQAQVNPELGLRGVWLRVEDGRIVAVVQPYAAGVAAD